MKPIKDVLNEAFHSLSPKDYEKFLLNEIAAHWYKLVTDKDIVANARPIDLENGVLCVKVTSSSFKDQLKFHAEEIIDAINGYFGNEVVNKILPAKEFQVAAFNERQRKPPVIRKPPAEVSLDGISLTNEETARCKVAVQKIADENLRAATLKTLLLRAKSQKFKLADGWHKCKTCDSLCAAGETFCEVCRLVESEKIRRKLFEIFYDTPWLSSEDVRKIFLDKFPNQQCPLDFVNSTRTSLIQLLAGRLTLDEADDGSKEILRLVMLERQLPPDKITPAIIRRTLSELHFNFAAPVRFPRHKFSKFHTLQHK